MHPQNLYLIIDLSIINRCLGKSLEWITDSWNTFLCWISIYVTRGVQWKFATSWFKIILIQYLFIILTSMATNKQYWLFLDLYLAIQSIFIGFIEFFFDIFDLFDSYYYINFLLQKFQTYWVYSKYFWLPAKFCLSFSLIILLMANIYHFHQNQLIHLVFLKLL